MKNGTKVSRPEEAHEQFWRPNEEEGWKGRKDNQMIGCRERGASANTSASASASASQVCDAAPDYCVLFERSSSRCWPCTTYAHPDREARGGATGLRTGLGGFIGGKKEKFGLGPVMFTPGWEVESCTEPYRAVQRAMKMLNAQGQYTIVKGSICE